MNIFVLSTGRCGSLTFIKACRHIRNYTAGHETRRSLCGIARLQYPDNHIESDNRLSWLLGRLDERYGRNPLYVHLTRDRQATSQSFDRRWAYTYGIINTYGRSILMSREQSIDVCLDYWDNVNANIRLFLRDKPNQMRFALENAQDHFREFWRRSDAVGDLSLALSEWTTRYNSSPSE